MATALLLFLMVLQDFYAKQHFADSSSNKWIRHFVYEKIFATHIAIKTSICSIKFFF